MTATQPAVGGTYRITATAVLAGTHPGDHRLAPSLTFDVLPAGCDVQVVLTGDRIAEAVRIEPAVGAR